MPSRKPALLSSVLGLACATAAGLSGGCGLPQECLTAGGLIGCYTDGGAGPGGGEMPDAGGGSGGAGGGEPQRGGGAGGRAGAGASGNGKGGAAGAGGGGVGNGSGNGNGNGEGGGGGRRAPTNGGAVAITADNAYAVAANRTAGRVTIFKLDLGGATPASKQVDLDVGRYAEPWAVVIGNDDDTAYVILRAEQRVLRIRNLRQGPRVDTLRARTGAEPTGLAISPSGARLYVANWAEGTVTVVDTDDMTVADTVDLNGALAYSGVLGDDVVARPGLAHPRALVVTDDGDEDDDNETVYVTEFFSQARNWDLPADDSRFDVGRQALVYSFSAGDHQVGEPITIDPVADTGFVDSKGTVTGCFPNQLYAAAINQGRLYVTSVCESPRGPTGPDAAPVAPGTAVSNFKTQVHAAIFVIDLESNHERPEQGLLLTREFDRMFAARGTPDDASRRLPLIPNDIVFVPDSGIAYVTGYGSDAVFRIAYKPDGSLDRVGAATQPFINLKPGGAVAAGELPIGIAVANASAAHLSFAVALNENSRNLSVISFGTQSVVSVVPTTDAPAPGIETARNRGQKFFATGLGRWSLNGQAWNSCAACHPDGLTDNVTWFFARGPRQTTALDGSYDPRDPGRRRVFNWTGIFDEVHDFELNTRGNSGGVGAIVHTAGPPVVAADRIIFDGTPPAAGQQATATPQAGLNGSTISLMPGGSSVPRSVLPDWDEIDAYVESVRAPRAPTNLDPYEVIQGRHLFQANGCAGCHGGSQWTIATVFYTPSEENNAAAGLLRTTFYTRPLLFPEALNPPTAGLGTAPLRFDRANPAANDQINCVLRDVGTFPAMGNQGVAPEGVEIKETRQDMVTLAQGQTGFNIPSLLGMVTGAPYFHAGAARTLEEAMSETFDRHRRAFAENFQPDDTQLQQLTAFLLSIDETTPPPASPAFGFPVDLCAQVPAGRIR
jgi:YVTN family beta-propeller protein